MLAARDPRALWRRGDGEVFVLGADADVPRVLTGLLAAVWEVLETPVRTEELAEDVSAALDVPILQAEETVAQMLEELTELGAVTCTPTQP